MSDPRTWAEVRDSVLADMPGLCPETLDIVRRAGAAGRHEHRVARAIVAALRATEDAPVEGQVHQTIGGTGRTLPQVCAEVDAGDATWLDVALAGYGLATGCVSDHTRQDHLRRAATLCAIGSTDVAGSARPIAFRGLGKGRRHARDGEAWTAAIREACGRLCVALGPQDTPSGSYEPTPEAAEVLVHWYLPADDRVFVADWLREQIRALATPRGFLEHERPLVLRLDAALRAATESP